MISPYIQSAHAVPRRALSRRMLALLVLCLALCPPAAAQEAAIAKPLGLKLLPDTPRGHLGEPYRDLMFPETQRLQLLLVYFDKSAVGQAFRFTIRAVETTAPQSAALLSGEASVTAEGVVPLQVRLPENWPVGTYEVILSRAGQLVAALPYRVAAEKPRTSPITVASISIEHVVAPGQTEAVAPVRAGYRHLNFAAMAKGVNTEGVKLTWVLTAEQTRAGKGEAARFETAGRLIENTEVQCDLSNPEDWPTGRYRIDLLIDDKPAASRVFQIDP